MKAKYLYLAVLAVMVAMTACKKDEPFDTQSKDDAPLILKPYNESGTGSFTYNLANPDVPLLDSVTVTPSDYTTVNWYIDEVLVHTGTKIQMNFMTGTYALLIEAVTDAGKRTTRSGSVTVGPYNDAPYAAAPAGGFHLVPGVAMQMTGQNLSRVAEVVLSNDFYTVDEVCACAPSSQDDSQITFTLPEVADGAYYVRFRDPAGLLFGSGNASVHNGAVILAGYEEFVPGDTWVMTGVNLDNVASVKVDETVVTALTVTSTSVTLTAPAAEVGEHTLSMTNKDGSVVLFVTSEGTVSEVKTIVSNETTLWTGPNYIQWDENRVRVESDVMTQVPAGATIIIYWEKLPAGHEGYYEGAEYKEYQKMKVMTAWWTDLFPEFDVTDDTPCPYSFTYDQTMKDLVEGQNALSIAGWGLMINKITYK